MQDQQMLGVTGPTGAVSFWVSVEACHYAHTQRDIFKAVQCNIISCIQKGNEWFELDWNLIVLMLINQGSFNIDNKQWYSVSRYEHWLQVHVNWFMPGDCIHSLDSINTFYNYFSVKHKLTIYFEDSSTKCSGEHLKYFPKFFLISNISPGQFGLQLWMG